jgi:hypothetical protein
MRYWIKRIALQSGEVVTEAELREDENLFEGPVPVVGDVIDVRCRGREFQAEVVWGNWPDRSHSPDALVPLRVAEIGLRIPHEQLQVPRRSDVTRKDWISGGIVLGNDPTANVACPACRVANLTIHDVRHSTEEKRFDRYLSCPVCEQQAVLGRMADG